MADGPEDIKMKAKLTITQIAKSNDEVLGSQTYEFESTERAIKLLASIDKQMSKGTIKFKYTIEEVDE